MQTFGEGVDHPLAKRGISATSEEAAVSFLEAKLGLNATQIKAKSGYDADTASHVYIRQKLVGGATLW